MLSWADLQQFRLLNKEESSIYTLPHARGRFIFPDPSLSIQPRKISLILFLEKERDRDRHLGNALAEVAVLVPLGGTVDSSLLPDPGDGSIN